MSRTELERLAVEAQQRVTRELVGSALRDLIDQDLSMAQLKALAVIEQQPDCSMGMLSEVLGVKPPAASLLVEKLVRAGLVRRARDERDGRRVIVQPTAEGWEHLSRVRLGSRSALEDWVARLADDDLAALVDGLSALADIARRPRSARAEYANR